MRGHHRHHTHHSNLARQMIWLPYCHHEYSSNTTRHGKAAIFITDVDGDVLARVRVGARVCSRAAGEIDVIQRAKEKCAVDRQSRDFVIVQAPPLRHMHGIFSPTQLLPQEHPLSFPAKIKHIIVVSWNDEIPFSSQGGTHTMHLLCFTKALNNSIAAAGCPTLATRRRLQMRICRWQSSPRCCSRVSCCSTEIHNALSLLTTPNILRCYLRKFTSALRLNW